MDQFRTSNEQLEEDCLHALEEQATPTSNDVEIKRNIEYINKFLSYFGKERVYLVGSTGEETKLSVSIDSGDADFLIVSGRFEIDVNAIEARKELPVYVWVKADNIDRHINLIDGKYLNANMLRELRRDLFTVGRGIYLVASADIDRIPAANAEVTTLGLRSKVGLAVTTYKGIEVVGNIEPRRHQHIRKMYNHRCKVSIMDFNNQWRKLDIHQDDVKILKRLVHILRINKVPGGGGRFHGNLAFFSRITDDALQKTAFAENDEIDDDSSDEEGIISFENDLDEEDSIQNDILLRYSDKRSKDFVPAIRIKGKLKCMEVWKERVTQVGWPKDKVRVIYESDLFLIPRQALVDPRDSLDFCLAFNFAEMKIVKQFSRSNRLVYLILKSLRKGIFEYEFKKHNKTIKLQTYHMKTVMFWILEPGYNMKNGIQTIDYTEEVSMGLSTALGFLHDCLKKRQLKHYFTESNLFADFNDGEFVLLLENVQMVRRNSNEWLKTALVRNDNLRGEVLLSREETERLLMLKEDGGKQINIERVRDAIIDIGRGVKECRRHGNVVLKEAIVGTTRKALQAAMSQKHKSEVNKTDATASTCHGIQTGGSDIANIFKSIQTFVGNRKENKEEADKRINSVISLVDGLGKIFPKATKAVESIGGTSEIRSILEGASNADAPSESQNEIEDVMETIERFLNCHDDEMRAVANELKYKLITLFV